MKKIVLFVLMLIPLWLAAQDMPFTVRAKTRFASSGMIGYETIDSLTFYRARLIQEFKFWKIGIGLDLDFLFDKDYRLRVSDWDHWENVLDKFYYIKFANRRDPVYVHLGGFPDLTIGNGLIMKKYNNMQLYPELRNPGLMIGANPNIPTSPSFELFTSNLKKNEIMSFSARFRPMPDSTLAVIDEMILGLSLAIDRNQFGNIKYVTADSLNSDIALLSSRPATVIGAAITLPVYRTDQYTLGTYAEFAHIAGLGSGAILPGVYADFKFMKLNLEYRTYGRQFTPAFFDEDYEEERGYFIDSLAVFRTKEDYVSSLNPATGINGIVEGNYKDRVKASVTWQNIIGDDYKYGKSLWLKLWVDTQYKRLENFSLTYSRTNQERLSIARVNEPNTKMGLSMTFRVAKRWYVIGKYSESFKDRNGDGEVNWLKETKHSGGLGVKYLH
ncbi:MAG TPA: hypothetical protein PKX36_07965 [Candidatus Cloacimonadota bacterium]|nr:hypothetical protein [Candidatus Cloacimonadota bacterium]